MAKFKVGDQVRACKESAKKHFVYPYGINESRWNDSETHTVTAVNWQSDDQGSYRLDNGDLAWPAQGLVPAEHRREFVVIHRSGNVMTAELRVNREVIKSAKATCNEADVFDFDTGAKLAFDRLMGRESDEAMPRCKMPKPAPKPAHRFKVGDRVNVSGWGSGTVIGKSQNAAFQYIVAVDRPTRQEMFFNEDRLSPAPEPPKYVPHIGDRVVTEHGNGTVMAIKGTPPILVLHDNWKFGHDAGSTCPDFDFSGSRCWWFHAIEIKPLKGESDV